MMEEVRQLVQEEGREARNLIAFHVSMDSPASKVSRKPPKAEKPSPPASQNPARRVTSRSNASRLRSASAGRDKRSELQARYWALLFGNLQRAIGEIYTTVESHENLSECQEVILVLENYTRDFKALCEWFRVKWEYDNTPPPQRPQSLAWEVRKTDFVKPDAVRGSVRSSPSVSGKNSPMLSGHNTPTGKSSPTMGKVSPRITSPKTNQEFFSIKTFQTKSPITRLSNISERVSESINLTETMKLKELLMIGSKKYEESKANTDEKLKSSNASVKTIKNIDINGDACLNYKDAHVLDKPVDAKTTDEETSVKHKTEGKSINRSIKIDSGVDYRYTNDVKIVDKKVKDTLCEDNVKDATVNKKLDVKQHVAKEIAEIKQPEIGSKVAETMKIDAKDKGSDADNKKAEKVKISTQSKVTIEIMNKMENEFVKKQVDSDIKRSETVKTAIKAAYSQAAAKPKVASAKVETKPKPKDAQQLTRSKTIAEIRPRNIQPVKRNQKCSYPFNLTTGRSNLFEPKNTKNYVKTNIKLASGDQRNKSDARKTSQCKIDTKAVEIKNDIIRNESSDSVKTLVPDDVDLQNDGWLTVKSRKLSKAESKNKTKSHWSNRFNQPSATTSLPTLNTIEPLKTTTSPIKILDKAADKVKKQIVRQKSDMTGLKTRKPSKGIITKKKMEVQVVQNRLHSSLESLLQIGLLRSQEEVSEDRSEFDNCLLSKYIKESGVLKEADEKTLEMLKCLSVKRDKKLSDDECDSQLEAQSEADAQKLNEEEDLLNKQIEELQHVSDTDLDIETDDTETDAEVLCEERANETDEIAENLDLAIESLEDRYEPALSNMSWADRVDTLAKLEALVARYPGRAQQLHAKLSQGIRRRGSLQETLKRCIIKQDRAERQRQELQRERSEKLHQLLARVEDVKTAKNLLIEAKRARMEQRLQKAAENRNQHLQDRVRKAHDEEEKLREIAFIKQLEAEHRRHDFMVQCKTHNNRLRQIRRDRLRRMEATAARSAAAMARRGAAEAARRDRLIQRAATHAARTATLKPRVAPNETETEPQITVCETRTEDETVVAVERKKTKRAKSKSIEEKEKINTEVTECVKTPDPLKEKQKALRKRMRKLKLKLIQSTDEIESNQKDEEPPVKTNITRPIVQITNLLSPFFPKICSANQSATDKTHKKRSKKTIDTDKSLTIDDMSNDAINQCDLTKNREKKNLSMNDSGNLLNGNTKMDKFSEDSKKSKGKGSECLDNVVRNEMVNESAKKIDDNINKICMNNKIDMSNDMNNSDDLSKHSIDFLKNDNIDKSVDNAGKLVLSKFDSVVDAKDTCQIMINSNGDKSRKAGQKKRVESVCSSISEISKDSLASVRQLTVKSISIDCTSLDRALNELSRIIEKNRQDRFCIIRNQGLKAIGDLLHIASECDNIISNKCVYTAINILWVCMKTNKMVCLRSYNSNIPIYLVQFINTILVKENMVDSDRVLLDAICTCFRLMFEAVRTVEEPAEGNAYQFRLRTYMIVRIFRGEISCPALLELVSLYVPDSYLRASYLLCLPITLNAGLEPIDYLIASMAKICQPMASDAAKDNSERLCCTRGLRGTMDQGVTVRLSGIVTCSATSSPGNITSLVTAIAQLVRLDHTVLQEALGSGMEFQAAATRLLSAYAPTDRDPNRQPDLALENMICDLIETIGYLALTCDNDECIWACRYMCSMPACRLRGRVVAAITSLYYSGANTAREISAELSTQMLDEFLESEDARKIRLARLVKSKRDKLNSQVSPKTKIPS